MKKFGISMAVIMGMIVVFIASGLIAFHSFPENNKKPKTEQAVGANMFSDEDPYLNTNKSASGLLTIITPSTDKAKTIVRTGTVDDIVVYEKNTTIEEIDVGEVEEQKSIFDEPPVKTETEKKPSDKPEKKEEKPKTPEKKEEPTEEKEVEEPTKAAETKEEPEKKEEVQKPEEEPEEKAEESEKNEEENVPPVEEEAVEENVEEVVIDAPKSGSLPPSMQEGGKATLDPDKYYSDTGI